MRRQLQSESRRPNAQRHGIFRANSSLDAPLYSAISFT
jgi:hypothetical protein